MTDRYQQFTATPIGNFLSSKLGLPRPAVLRRYEPGQPLLDGPALLSSAPGGRLEKVVRNYLTVGGVKVLSAPLKEGKHAALIFDATGLTDPAELRTVYEFFHPVIRRLAPSGRVLVLGTPPESLPDRARVTQRALEGFVRSVAKELKNGATAQLVYVAEGAEAASESTVRFLLSSKSAFVDGQVFRIGTQGSSSNVTVPSSWEKPLEGKVALVTGAAQGIGAAIARVLARDGAHVVALDIPAQGADLSTVANEIQGSSIQLNITATDAPGRLAEHLRSRHSGVDIVVHNAGITRDKTLGNLSDAAWDSVLAVNLSAQLAINDKLLSDDLLKHNGRIIGVSSIAGIAGNRGQTNYATSKAGVMGMVDVLAPVLARKGSTINAVAPGFIETKMTAAVPLLLREAGRLLSSLNQGGLPVDVAETVAWYANPASAAVNGNVIRVCGQALLGA